MASYLPTADSGDTCCDCDRAEPCDDCSSGACCDADLNCAIQSQADCEAGGGVYMGNDTVCDPNPCVYCCENAFVHNGNYYMQKQVCFSGTSHSESPNPVICCDASASPCSLLTIDPDTCAVTVECSGTGHLEDCNGFSRDYVWQLFGSNCGWDFNGSGGAPETPVGACAGIYGCTVTPTCPTEGFLENETDNCHGTCTEDYNGSRDWSVTVVYSNPCVPTPPP